MTTCVRRAWLTLGGNTIYLEDADAGYYCTSLDLGSPDVREVMNNRPDQDGADDRTQFLGARAVSAEITATQDIDTVATSFAPFMAPSVRPVLHYVLDRPGAPERQLTVRAAAYAWPIAGPDTRDIKLQWVASDPIIRDPTTHTATASAGSSTTAGRYYNLVHPRVYPAGGASPSDAIIRSNGDIPVQPLLRIYGPITGPIVHFASPSIDTFVVGFLPTFTIGAGAWVDVDTRLKTAFYQGDPNQNVLTSLDWPNLKWPVLPVGVNNVMTLTGTGIMTPVTQVVATWQDGYLA